MSVKDPQKTHIFHYCVLRMKLKKINIAGVNKTSVSSHTVVSRLFLSLLSRLSYTPCHPPQHLLQQLLFFVRTSTKSRWEPVESLFLTFFLFSIIHLLLQCVNTAWIHWHATDACAHLVARPSPVPTSSRSLSIITFACLRQQYYSASRVPRGSKTDLPLSSTTSDVPPRICFTFTSSSSSSSFCSSQLTWLGWISVLQAPA